MKFFARFLSLILAVGVAHAGPVYNYVLPGGAVNVLYYNVKCDGSTDDYANFNRALAAVPTGGTLFIPPSATACMLSQPLAPSHAVTIQADAGTVVLKPTAGNTSSPVLLSINAQSNVTVKGVTFDGGGTSFANTNNVVTVFNSSNITFDGAAWQNTRGIAVLISSSTNTGVKNSSFTNIGNYWQTSGLSTDRKQAIAFCCSSPTQPQKNYATGNYFNSIGLDAVSATNQLDFLASGNRCQLSTAQTAQAFGNWPACIYGQANTEITVTNNISDSAPGNGIDMASSTTGAVITGNYVTSSGGAGISVAGVSNFEITANELINNGSNTTSCQRDGIDFLDSVNTGTVASNIVTDTRGGGSKTQQYGIFAFTGCSHAATLTNVILDQNNQTISNAVAGYGGGVSTPSAPTILYARTAREISASITPTAYNYPEGDAVRYGADPTGVADSTTAIQNAISVMSQTPVNGKVILDPGTYLVSGSGLTLANYVTISGYGAVVNYTGTGYAIHTPSTGVTLQPGVLGVEIDIGASAAGALSLASSVHGAYRDIRIAGTSSTSAIAILLGVNTSGTTNGGNRNTAFNELDNILVDTLVGTGVRFIGDATVPTVVTLNTFLNFNISGSGNAATYGVEFNAWADSNRFDGVTRISLQSVTSAAGVGVIWNSGTPASNVGVYAETFDHLAVDCFGSPSGDARAGIVYNNTKQNHVTYYYQYPECAGGPIVKNGPVGSNYIYHVTDNSSTVSELLMQSGSVQLAGIANFPVLSLAANTTTGQALGPVIYGGTNTSDYTFSVKNAANTTQYMQMRGDGSLVVGPSSVVYEGAGTLNAQGLYVNGTAVSTATAANPTATITTTATNGSATTFMRSDAAPALSTTMSPTMTGNWTFTPGSGTGVTVNGKSGTPGVAIKAGSTTDPGIDFQSQSAGFAGAEYHPNGGAQTAFIGAAGASGQYVPGAATGDIIFRNIGANRWTIDGGTTNNMTLGGSGGLELGSPTGGDEGNGTLNAATNIYINGTAVSTATAANPTGTITTSATNGSATTFMRSDATPALSTTMSPTMTGNWTFNATSGTPVSITAPSGSFGLIVTPNGSNTAINIPGAASGVGQINLRGNGNAGGSGFLVNQDASGVANLNQQANANMNLATNNTTRFTLNSDGGLTSNGVTGGDKGAGSINAGSLYAAGNQLQSITGTYTGTLTGVSGTVTGTVHYRVDGQTASLWVDADITGTSNANTLTITGGVAAMEPAANRVVACGNMEDNGVGNQIMGQATISSGGVVTLAKLNSTPVASSTNWTTSGVKGVNAGWSITYPLQ